MSSTKSPSPIRVVQKSASPDRAAQRPQRDVRPYPVGTRGIRKLPTIEDLQIPPYKSHKHNIISLILYKFSVETALSTLEPWERYLTSTILLSIVAYSTYLMCGALVWFVDLVRQEIEP